MGFNMISYRPLSPVLPKTDHSFNTDFSHQQRSPSISDHQASYFLSESEANAENESQKIRICALGSGIDDYQFRVHTPLAINVAKEVEKYSKNKFRSSCIIEMHRIIIKVLKKTFEKFPEKKLLFLTLVKTSQAHWNEDVLYSDLKNIASYFGLSIWQLKEIMSFSCHTNQKGRFYTQSTKDFLRVLKYDEKNQIHIEDKSGKQFSSFEEFTTLISRPAA
jgi:hypothetical protein